MTTRKRIAWVDRCWADMEDRKVYGDMYFTFQESSDTRSDDVDGLVRDCRQYCMGDEAIKEGEASGVERAVYEVWTADCELDDPEDYLWSGTIDDATKTLVAAFVCGTKEECGWVEDECEMYKGLTEYRK